MASKRPIFRSCCWRRRRPWWWCCSFILILVWGKVCLFAIGDSCFFFFAKKYVFFYLSCYPIRQVEKNLKISWVFLNLYLFVDTLQKYSNECSLLIQPKKKIFIRKFLLSPENSIQKISCRYLLRIMMFHFLRKDENGMSNEVCTHVAWIIKEAFILASTTCNKMRV